MEYIVVRTERYRGFLGQGEIRESRSAWLVEADCPQAAARECA